MVSETWVVVTISVWCTCVCVHCACVCPSDFVRAITSTFMHVFQNNLAQLFSLRRRSAFETFLGGLKVKVTLEGQMIKWSEIKLVQAILRHLCMDFKLIWHSCSP